MEAGPPAPAPISLIKRRLLSGGAWAFAGQVVVLLTGVPGSFFLARLLSPAALGNYFLALSIVAFGAIAGSLGLNQVLVRFVAGNLATRRQTQARRVLRIVFSIGVPYAAAVGIVYVLVGDLVARDLFKSAGLGAVTALIGCWIVAVSVQTLLSDGFRGFNDLRSATIFGNPLAAIALLIGLAVLWSFKHTASLSNIVMLAVMSVVGSCLAGAWLLRRKTVALPRSFRSEDGGDSQVHHVQLLRVALPLLAANLIQGVFGQSDLWIVGSFRPKPDVAIYGVAFRAVALVGVPGLVLGAVLLPVVAEMYAQNRKEELQRVLRGSATAVGFPVLVIMIGFILAGGPLLGAVYGSYYEQGGLILAILSLSHLGVISFGSCGLALVMSGHEKLILLISVSTGVVTIAAEFILVQSNGLVGVAAASAGGTVLLYLATWLAVRATSGIWTHISLNSAGTLIRDGFGWVRARRSLP